MRRSLLIIIVCLMAAASVFAGSQVRLTGNVALDFIERPSVQQVLQSFNNKDQIFFWGFGWEVVLDRVGLGGMYDTNFYKDVDGEWWLDWLAEPVYLSYHLFRGGAFIDPFITVGLGCSGRVFLGGIPPLGKDGLYLSIFPSVGAGLALDFDGLLLSARLSYVPTMTSPPVTDIENYPLKKFYVTLSAGVALGSH